MNLIEEEFVPEAQHDGEPSAAAEEFFQNYDFGDIEVIDSDGALSFPSPRSPNVSSKIRFYAKPESGEGDSVAMLFTVDFSRKGARIGVYSL